MPRSYQRRKALDLIHVPIKTKNIAAITNEAQKIPIPAITIPASVPREVGGGTSEFKIFFVLIKGRVITDRRAA